MPRTKQRKRSVDDVYEMEKIIGFKQDRNTDYFKIKWKGYDLSECTWEPRKNIINPDDDQKTLMKILKEQWAAEHNRTGDSVEPVENSKDLLENTKITEDTASEGKKAASTSSTISKAKNNESPVHILSSDLKSEASQPAVSQPQDTRKVLHVREIDKKVYVFVRIPGRSGSPSTDMQISINEAKEKYTNELLDYLLHRIRFSKNAARQST